MPLYWIIDAERKIAEIWTPSATAPVIETTRLSWSPNGAIAPFTVTLADLMTG